MKNTIFQYQTQKNKPPYNVVLKSTMPIDVILSLTGIINIKIINSKLTLDLTHNKYQLQKQLRS